MRSLAEMAIEESRFGIDGRWVLMSSSFSSASNHATNSSSPYVETRQIGLFVEPKPDLIVDRVPYNLALGDDLYYIHYGDWFAGIQLTRDEAYRAIEQIGSRRDPEAIYAAIEQAIEGGAA
jgi:hypothetical protein